MPQTGVTAAVRLRYFAVAVAMAAVAVPLLIAAPGSDVPASPIVFPWWALAAAFILTELFIVNIHVQRDTHTVSLGEIPFILGLAMASPLALLLGRVVGSTFILVVHRRQALHKIIFNLGIFVLDTAVAIAAYRVLLSGRSQVSAAGLGAGFVALLAAVAVGVIAVGGMIRLAQPKAAFRPAVRSLLAGSFLGIVSAALATGGLFLSWQDPLALIGVAIAAGGLYAIVQIYGTMGKRYGDLEAMYSFTLEIDGAVATDELVEVTLTQMRDFFGAEFAEAVLSRGVGSTAVTLSDSGIQRRPAPPALAASLELWQSPQVTMDCSFHGSIRLGTSRLRPVLATG